jgi:hypothetical protein
VRRTKRKKSPSLGASNRHALREFCARALADALGVKQEIEKTLAQNGRLAK